MLKKFLVNKDYHNSRFDRWFKQNISNVPQAGHFGLLNLKLRAERIGGNVDVVSKLGYGTSVVGNIPITRNSDKLTQDIIERKY